jgi:hypothetical protein
MLRTEAALINLTWIFIVRSHESLDGRGDALQVDRLFQHLDAGEADAYQVCAGQTTFLDAHCEKEKWKAKHRLPK